MARGKSGTVLEVMHTSADLRSGYAAPSCRASDGATSRLFAPEGYSLWLAVAQLDAGATVEWPSAHGDEAVYVASGALTIDGTRCDAGGAVVVESDVAAVARAEEATELVHVGPATAAPPTGGPLGPAATAGHDMHVVSGAALDPIQLGSLSHLYYADSTCPTCRIAFFRIDGREPHSVPSHVHSEDEIIHVLAGALQVGPQTVGAGMSIAIPAERRYSFRTTGAFSFLNYRADSSTVTMAPGSRAFEETARALRDLAERHLGDFGSDGRREAATVDRA